MIFGADKIPEIAKGMGKGMRSLKNATNDIKDEIKRSAENQEIDTDFTKDISQEINKAKQEINDIEGSIRREL
jgi:sec-independent protein translocase protein TatA|tara:strand:+ start:221 stop:439 length:219 start_codon:yes stop_codon:yes gene_type:complete